MFLEKYMSKLKYDILCDIYDDWYIEELEENTFIKIYNLFKKYNFYFIEDIILNYLDIFDLEEETVEMGILSLKEELGNNFVYIVGNDMRYLERIYNFIEL